ncbi:MAG TPA: cytochrome c oxidase assembly protein [Solirubrobacteraceae bacterium]
MSVSGVADGVVHGLSFAGALAAWPAAVGVWSWSFDPPVALALAFAVLYWLSNRRTVAPARTRTARRLRHFYFYAGIAVVLIALASPLDAYSERLFWAHMTQHILLLVVAPPLIVLARPWVRLWRVLPLPARQTLGRSLARGHLTPLRRLGGFLGAPLPTFVLFCGVVLLWHVPVLFDATLSSETLHALEHTLFFVTALMFWKQVIDSPPLHAPLSELWRVVYLIGAMVVMWLLAIVIALAPRPLYSAYAHEVSRPGGISALVDQQMAAGIMWVPGSITFVLVLFVYLHRWLTPAGVKAPAARLVGDHQ